MGGADSIRSCQFIEGTPCLPGDFGVPRINRLLIRSPRSLSVPLLRRQPTKADRRPRGCLLVPGVDGLLMRSPRPLSVPLRCNELAEVNRRLRPVIRIARCYGLLIRSPRLASVALAFE